MVATVEFDTLAELMTDAGYTDVDIHAARQDFYNTYPELVNVPYSHSAGTIPTDAPVPLQWAMGLLRGMEIPFDPDDLEIHTGDEE